MTLAALPTAGRAQPETPLQTSPRTPSPQTPLAQTLPPQASPQTSPPQGEGSYVLDQAITGLDMLAKVAAICPRLGREDARARLLETVARERLAVSARETWEARVEEEPSSLMTPQQARRVVANAGGCDSASLAQWRGGALWLADTSTQVLAGDARADRVWPRQAALEQPLRLTVLGWQRNLDRVSVQLLLANDGPKPARVALLASQAFAGLCTQIASPNLPLTPGFMPANWAEVPPRGDMPALWILDAACKTEPRMNIGGTLVIDQGKGPVYRRFLLRGVGPAPVERASSRPPAQAGR